LAPSGLIEHQLVGIWQSLLGIEPIGCDDDFFELGGHSLLLTQLIGRYQQAFALKLAMPKLFELPTIAQLAEHIDNVTRTRQRLQMNAQSIEQTNADDIEEFEI
jgi:acyl carrier protein